MAGELCSRGTARRRLQSGLVWFLLLLSRSAGSATRFEITADQVAASVTPLETSPVYSIIHCALLCKRHNSCWAFNHRSSGICELLPESMQLCQAEAAADQLTVEEGSRIGLLCQHTCLQLHRQQPAAPSGVYRLAGWPVPVLCDQELDGGGWTLMLTSLSQTWTPDGTLTLITGRNQESPSISDDYSILEHGDHLISFGAGDRFLYRSVGD